MAKQLSGSPTNNFRVPLVGDLSGAIKVGQTDYDTGVGFWLGLDEGTPKLSLGDSTADKLTWDGDSLDIVGSLTATTGTIGGFTIGATTIVGGNLTLDSTGNIRAGQTDYDTGEGFWLGIEDTENHLFLPGISGNSASTPDSVAVSITGDIDIRVRVSLDDWTPTTTQTLVAKYLTTGNQRSFRFLVNIGGTLRLLTSADGATEDAGVSSSVVTGFADGTTHYLRVTRTASSGAVIYYTSEDGTAWTQLGASRTSTAGNIFDSTQPVVIGGRQNGTLDLLAGKVYLAQIYNGIAGTLAAEFNANDAAAGATSVVSSATGETWTINQSGATPAELRSGPIVKFSLGDSDGDSLTWDGVSLDITGSLTATTGTIGGFTIGSTSITATNLTLDSSGQRISLGSANDIVILDADDTTYRIWIGNATAASAPFSVSKTGALIATSATITGGDLTSSIINTGAVTETKLGDASVTSSKIGDSQVVEAKIGTSAVTVTKIGDGAVTTIKVGDLQITEGKLGTGAVTETKLGAAAVTTAKLANLAVTDAILAANAVTTTKITDTAVTSAKIAANTIVAGNIAAGTITTTEIAANTIVAGNIAAGTITTTEIAANTIVAGNIAAATITTSEIASNTIVAGNMNVTDLSAITANLGTITAGSISVINGLNTVGLTPSGTNAIFAGTTGSPQFKVTPAGALTATSATITGSITSTSGTIGGFTLSSGALTASNLAISSTNQSISLGTTNDIVILDADDATYRLWIGNATAASAPFRVTKAGAVTATSATITGSVTSTSGTIGGFTLSAGALTATNLAISSSGQSITLGSSNDIVILDADDATYRIWVGHATAGSAPFRVTKAGAVTASNITITGGSVLSSLLSGIIAQANLDVANQGWSQTSAFSVSDADTVAWGAGTFKTAAGTSYSIGAGNTGNMAAKTYIYLDTVVSTTAYQTTTTAATAVGTGKVLVAIAQNGTGEATYSVLSGQGGQNIDASSIVAGSITANEIAASTITSGKLSVSQLSAITADLGAITAGTITLDSSGHIKGGMTDYLTGTGFWLGIAGALAKFSVGNSSGSYMAWTGFALQLNGTIEVPDDSLLIDSAAITFGQDSSETLATVWGTLQVSSPATAEATNIVNFIKQNNGRVLQLTGNDQSPAANDTIYMSWFLEDSVGTSTEFARIATVATDVTNTSEDGRLDLWVCVAGTLTQKYNITGTAVQPHTSDGAALGATANMWSDLFLASGGVINWNNGGVTLTHDSGNDCITVGSGDLRITTAGTNSASAVTVGGTQTLTNKTLTSPIINTPSSSGQVYSGTYTPTLTNTTNLDSSTAFLTQYMRVGNTVTVAGKVQMNPTAAGAVVMGMSLPIASNFAGDDELGGIAYNFTTNQTVGISSDSTNDRALLNFTATDTANRAFWFTFTYQII